VNATAARLAVSGLLMIRRASLKSHPMEALPVVRLLDPPSQVGRVGMWQRRGWSKGSPSLPLGVAHAPPVEPAMHH